MCPGVYNKIERMHSDWFHRGGPKINGRMIVWLICDFRRTHLSMNSLHTLQDLMSVEFHGDAKLEHFMSTWHKVVGQVGHRVEPEELANVLVQKVEKSQLLSEAIKYWRRQPLGTEQRTYDFLLNSFAEVMKQQQMEIERKSWSQSLRDSCSGNKQAALGAETRAKTPKKKKTPGVTPDAVPAPAPKANPKAKAASVPAPKAKAKATPYGEQKLRTQEELNKLCWFYNCHPHGCKKTKADCSRDHEFAKSSQRDQIPVPPSMATWLHNNGGMAGLKASLKGKGKGKGKQGDKGKGKGKGKEKGKSKDKGKGKGKNGKASPAEGAPAAPAVAVPAAVTNCCPRLIEWGSCDVPGCGYQHPDVDTVQAAREHWGDYQWGDQ